MQLHVIFFFINFCNIKSAYSVDENRCFSHKSSHVIIKMGQDIPREWTRTDQHTQRKALIQLWIGRIHQRWLCCECFVCNCLSELLPPSLPANSKWRMHFFILTRYCIAIVARTHVLLVGEVGILGSPAYLQWISGHHEKFQKPIVSFLSIFMLHNSHCMQN